MWSLLLILLVIFGIIIFIPPSNSLIVIVLSVLIGVFISLLAKIFIKNANKFIKRLILVYLPVLIVATMLLLWQGILDFFLVAYIFLVLLVVEFFLRLIRI